MNNWNDDFEGLMVPVSQNDTTVKRLKTFYSGLPKDVVDKCEYHRIAAGKSALEHLLEIHSILAPLGRFAEFCIAAGINPQAAYNAISRAKNGTKRPSAVVTGKKLITVATKVNIGTIESDLVESLDKLSDTDLFVALEKLESLGEVLRQVVQAYTFVEV